jgi:copper(I)-binding protein
VLEPGGYHVMLIDLVAPLEVGQVIDVDLEFRSAAPLTVTVPVQAMGPLGATGDDEAADDDGADDGY